MLFCISVLFSVIPVLCSVSVLFSPSSISGFIFSLFSFISISGSLSAVFKGYVLSSMSFFKSTFCTSSSFSSPASALSASFFIKKSLPPFTTLSLLSFFAVVLLLFRVVFLFLCFAPAFCLPFRSCFSFIFPGSIFIPAILSIYGVLPSLYQNLNEMK